MLTRGIAVFLLVAWLWPASPGRLHAPRVATYIVDGTPAQRDEFYDFLDERAVATLARDPGIDAATLARVLGELSPVEVAVYELRDGERAIVWHVRVPDMWDGGYRISMLARRDGRWRKVGQVVSADDALAGWAVTVRPGGILLASWAYIGNGWPPEAAIAIAIDGDHVVTSETGDVPRLEITPTEIRLWRRVEAINPYPDEPLRASRWLLWRARDTLVATEESLSPWIDTLEAYCSGAHPEVASADVIHAVEGCDGDVSEVRQTSADEFEVVLPLLQWCYEDDRWSSARRELATLRLARSDGAWIVASSSGCDD